MIMQSLKVGWSLLKESAVKWDEDKVPRLAAALSYYTVFAMAPILVIVIAVASVVFGQEAAQGQIVGQIEGLVGHDGAVAIQDILKNSRKESAGIPAMILGGLTLMIGATGVFVELQDALNTVWGVTPKPGRGILGMLKDRVLSFTMILGLGFILLVSLVLSAALTALSSYMERFLPSIDYVYVLQGLNILLSFAVTTVLLALIFRVLPDAKIAWKDVWIGAAISSLLFSLGKYGIGLYLGQSSIASTYGAAGSLAILFVWVYYTSMILLLGAEFTQVYANRFGKSVVPSDNAILLTKKICVQPEESTMGTAGATVRSKDDPNKPPLVATPAGRQEVKATQTELKAESAGSRLTSGNGSFEQGDPVAHPPEAQHADPDIPNSTINIDHLSSV
jgi:membrane protein